MKKTLRTLFAVLALTLCLCLPAFAQEAKPAQPAAKEDKTVTDLTGRDAFLRDVKGFTTNFGGPYVFEQASRKSPADIYGAAPAEGSVAVLRIYTMSDDKGDASINASGHAFVSVTNVSDSDIAVGGLLIAPGKSLTIGTAATAMSIPASGMSWKAIICITFPIIITTFTPCRPRWMPTSWRC